MTRAFQRALLCILYSAVPMLTAAQTNKKNIDWERFLSRNDMVFDTLTTKWEEGLFTGNGLLGAMLYMKDSSTLRLEIGHTGVWDHRNNISALYGKARLPIGHFELKTAGRIIKNTARLDLWNAEARGEVITDKGTIKWRTLTLSQSDIIVFETNSTGEEKSFGWEWKPEISISSRTKFSKDIPEDYTANPPCIIAADKGIEYCRQPMLAGGDYTTSWYSAGDKGHRINYISVAIDQQHTSLYKALQAVRAATKKNLRQLIAVHRMWWHAYYPESFVSLPDARLESFYWIQQYKLAAATREGKPAIDLMGPWFRYTPWPAYWFNLNIQLTYSPLYTANRLALATGLVKMIDDAKEQLIKNVPEQYQHNAAALGRSGAPDMNRPVSVYQEQDTTAASFQQEMGNLTWCLYYYWLHYRYTMDEQFKNSLFPILKRSINYYLNVMTKGEDGKWHLPYTYSPEYPGGTTRDCNYDLSLFRWGCETLLKIDPDDSLATRWKDVLADLTDYPVDASGLRIGRDVPFAQSHRHYSHLLMIYPLYLMNWDQQENRALIEKSLQHWHSFPGALQGYSFTGGAAIYAMMGNGDKALNYLDQLLDKFVKPNTMYLESGPVIETPLAAAASIQDLLVQSWGGKIRIFPAIPGNWKNVSFKDLRTEGAFLVSAVRNNSETKWISIKSLAGEPCIIEPGIKGPLKIKGNNGLLTATGDGCYALHLRKGASVILYSNEEDLLIKAGPVVPEARENNYWGKK